MADTEKTCLQEQAEKIAQEWRRRHSPFNAPPYDTAPSYLKRSVYGLVKTRDGIKGGYAILEKLVRAERTVDGRAPAVQENPFFWGLLLVLSNDRTLGRSERSKFATELLYAHKHAVPPDLLIGFIYQVGGYSRIIEKLKFGEMEPWWQAEEDWASFDDDDDDELIGIGL